MAVKHHLVLVPQVDEMYEMLIQDNVPEGGIPYRINTEVGTYALILKKLDDFKEIHSDENGYMSLEQCNEFMEENSDHYEFTPLK